MGRFGPFENQQISNKRQLKYTSFSANSTSMVISFTMNSCLDAGFASRGIFSKIFGYYQQLRFLIRTAGRLYRQYRLITSPESDGCIWDSGTRLRHCCGLCGWKLGIGELTTAKRFQHTLEVINNFRRYYPTRNHRWWYRKNKTSLRGPWFHGMLGSVDYCKLEWKIVSQLFVDSIKEKGSPCGYNWRLYSIFPSLFGMKSSVSPVLLKKSMLWRHPHLLQKMQTETILPCVIIR